MIRRKTVFVVGAGASHELGLPLGDGLLKEIASSLDIVDNGVKIIKGSPKIFRTFIKMAASGGLKHHEYLSAAHRVRDAAYLGVSIDNVIHQQFDDEALVQVAKIGIAHQLLLAESNSDLRVHENKNTITWPNIRGTWLGRFCQMLVQDVEKSRVDYIFDNVYIVCFNYDRTISRFLPIFLDSQFSIGLNRAMEISKRLKIYHPYGSLGKLEWQDPADPVKFGDVTNTDLIRVSKNIKTFTESLEESDDLAEMRSALSAADRIVFLGFGYLTQNMQILTQKVVGIARSVIGTSYGLSISDGRLVEGQLRSFIATGLRSAYDPQLHDLKCEDFLRQNFRTITA